MAGGLTLAVAQAHLDKALEIAAEQRVKIAVAVVDREGLLVAGARMDGVPHLNLEVARRKANAAQLLSNSTQHLVDSTAVSDDPILRAGLAAMDDQIVLLPGGFPVMVAFAVVGGLGIAGGHYSQDHVIGEKTIAAMVPR